MNNILLSHPETPLKEHLLSTAKLARDFNSNKNNNILADLSYIVGLCHDLGKATEYFQEYLLKEANKSKLTNHSLLGALCGYFIAKEYIKDNSIYPFFCYLVIKWHHSDLKDISNEFNIDEDDINILKKQIDSIDEIKFKSILSCEGAFLTSINRDTLYQWVDNINSELKTIKRFLRHNQLSINDYFFLNLLYSALIDADRTSVIFKNAPIFIGDPELPISLINSWKQSKNFAPNSINQLREQAFNEVKSLDIDLKNRIYTLNLPTGMGKTIISLLFALKLREQVYKQTSQYLKIIYSLPFISIIEQNAKVIEEVLSTKFEQINTDLLLKHHHLSEIFYKFKQTEYMSDEAEFLIEGWNSNIIVTTFVQLFHTFFTNKSSSLRKFHRLCNSIIILDEVQAIPVKYWQLLNECLDVFANTYNCYIILSTATKPFIFSNYQSLCDTKYFNNFNRIELYGEINNKITIPDLAKKYIDEIPKDKQVLFILNTINSVNELYKLLKDYNPLVLSTYIIPKHRLERINKIIKNKHNLVISTQLVEAGVDIDFDLVIRDLAPLDSIIQAGGRCNRNDIKSKGNLIIVNLCDKNNKKFASYIYDSVLLDITERILNKYKIIPESKFLEVIESYYKELLIKKSQQESTELINAIRNLNYDNTDKKSISDFKLIQENYIKNDVFIEIDNEAKEVWDKFCEIKSISNIFERKQEFNKIKAKFYEYVVSIPIFVLQKNTPPINNNFYYVTNEQLEEFYDINTGFKVSSETIIW